MNPRDKAVAFKLLVDHLGSAQAASKETGVGEATIRKYVQLLELAPTLQDQLAAGDARNTDALASLARRFAGDPERQEAVWDRISGFRQDIQQEVIKGVEGDLGNLGELVNQAAEGRLGFHVVRNCPHDCPSIPAPYKQRVAAMIAEFTSRN